MTQKIWPTLRSTISLMLIRQIFRSAVADSDRGGRCLMTCSDYLGEIDGRVSPASENDAGLIMIAIMIHRS